MTEHGGAGHQLLEDHPTVVRFDLFADAHQAHPLTRADLGQRARAHVRRRRAGARDGVPVRAGGRIAQQLHQAGLDVVGDHVLPAARLPVHLVPLQPDHVDQQALGQAVLAHHLLGQRAPALGQVEAPSLARDVTIVDEPLTLLDEGGFIPGVVAEVGERDLEGNLEVSVEGGGEGIRVSRDLSDRSCVGAP